MPKRFTDTNKYKKPFIRSLSAGYKLLWDFLYHDCDHAGIWIVDFEIAKTYVGKDVEITKDGAIELFNQDEKRIVELDGGKKWFIPSFIEFQYGKLSEKNRAHISAISILKKLNLLNDDLSIKLENKPHIRPLQGAKEMDMEQEQEKELDKETLGKSENLFTESSLLGTMLTVWKEKNTNYPTDAEDLPALRKISEYICRQEGISYQPNAPDVIDLVLSNWRVMSEYASEHKLYSGFNLWQIYNYRKNLVTEIKNGSSTQKNGKQKPGSKITGSQLNEALTKFRSQGKQPANTG